MEDDGNGKLSSNAQQVIRLVTFATTENYVEGAVCLAQSLASFELPVDLECREQGEGTPQTVPAIFGGAKVSCSDGTTFVLKLLPLVTYCSPAAAARLGKILEDDTATYCVVRDGVDVTVPVSALLDIRLVPSEPVLEASGDAVSPVPITTSENKTPEVISTHSGKGARIEFDAPRRLLWTTGEPFVYIDADIICVRSPWRPLIAEVAALAESSTLSSNAAADEESLSEPKQMLEQKPHFAVAACPAFRIKKKRYNEGGSGFFNAGLVICTHPNAIDGASIGDAVSEAITSNADTTEEQILGTVFKERWRPLPPQFNAVKRAAKFAPELWDEELVHSAIFVHFVGAKPWLTEPALRAAMDWDADGYEELERLWWNIRNQQLGDITDRFIQASKEMRQRLSAST
eukprot:INCI11631.1.p1 GENE.INCI11631.1~~INCI11631.1.p1  ORF type:complete len:403 (-),score=80.68 INCI11631.1:270-1478(-)